MNETHLEHIELRLGSFEVRCERLERLAEHVKSQLDEALCLLRILTKEMLIMTPEIQALTDQVAANTAVEASAVTLIQGLAAQISANANDPAAISALASQLKTSADALGAAVVANTPAAPPAPAPAPPPAPAPAPAPGT